MRLCSEAMYSAQGTAESQCMAEPDNPGDARFCTISPGRQIYVCNLLDNW